MSATAQLAARPKPVQELKSRPSGVVFSLKLVVYLITLAHGVIFSLSIVPSVKTVGILLIGLMFAHGVELQHQALHYQGFKSNKYNTFFGILLGLPMLVSFHEYQYSHLRHHRRLGTPENKEYFDYGDQYGEGTAAAAWLWVLRLSMIMHYGTFFKNVIRSVCFLRVDNVNATVSKAIRMDYLAMIIAVVLLTSVSVILHAWLIVWVWLAPLMLVAAPVHALIEMPEHYRCDLTSTDPLRNTRTIKSNAFMTWFTNGNNYHVEHHMMPGLSMDRLQDLHYSIEGDLRHYHRTYRAFYGALLRGRLTPRAPAVESRSGAAGIETGTETGDRLAPTRSA